MGDSQSSERMRHSALELLASGNTLQAVAHVFDVPVETVMAWRVAPAPSAAGTPTSKAQAAATSQPAETPVPRADAAPLTFRDTLDYAGSGAMRITGMVCGILLAVVMLWCAISIWRTNPGDVGTTASVLMVLLVGGIGTFSLLRLTPRTLVMGHDTLVAPGLFGDDAMAYSEVAGYALADGVLRLGDNSDIKGQTLSIRSRRVGAEPLEVFIYDRRPVPPAMLERLDEVVRANHGAPPLPARIGPRPAARSATAGALLLLVIMGVGVLQFLPGIINGVHVLRHGMPALASLQHREGKVTAVSVCYQPAAKGAVRSMKIVLDDAPGAPMLVLPCLLDDALLMNHQPHRLAVDLDPGSTPAGLVYQIALDGQVALDYASVKAAQRRDVIRPAQVETVSSLLVVAFSIGLFLWMMRRRRVAATAR